MSTKVDQNGAPAKNSSLDAIHSVCSKDTRYDLNLCMLATCVYNLCTKKTGLPQSAKVRATADKIEWNDMVKSTRRKCTTQNKLSTCVL